MKKAHSVSLAVLAAMFVYSFLAWAFSQHGTIGLFRVNGQFRLIFIGLALFGLALPVLALLRARLQKRRNSSLRLLGVLVFTLTAIGIVLPLSSFFYLNGFPSSGITSLSPQLLVADGSGSQSIPDIALTFYTQTPTQNTIYWGKANTKITVNEEKSAQQHVLMLRNLEPATDYWYQINDGNIYHFNTASVNGQGLHFAAGGDTHFGIASSRSVTEQILQRIADPANNFDYFFPLGDLVNYGFSDKQWDEAFRSLFPTISVIPTRFAVGNHDTLFSGLRHYEDYCYPAGMDIQTGSRLWYRIDVGKAHFLVIDLEWSAESFTQSQAAWLEEQLKSIPAEHWKIVMGHGFYFASGAIVDGWRWYDNPETINKLTPLFEKYGVDLVFSGHAHQLEMLQKSGVTYIICGGLGGVPDEEREYTSPASIWYMAGKHAFVDVTLDSDTASIVFRNPDNTELSRFAIPKDK